MVKEKSLRLKLTEISFLGLLVVASLVHTAFLFDIDIPFIDGPLDRCRYGYRINLFESDTEKNDPKAFTWIDFRGNCPLTMKMFGSTYVLEEPPKPWP